MNGIDQVLQALELNASEERAAFARAYSPTASRIVGATMPQVNEITSELKKSLMGKSNEDQWKVVKSLLSEGVFEASLIGWDLVARQKQLMLDVDESRAKDLLVGVDNWVATDTIGPRVLGPAWRLGQLSDQWVASLQDCAAPFHRRLALTMTIGLNLKSRGGKGDVQRTLSVAQRASDDSHDMVIKALSWALRQLVPWDAVAVSDFLEKNQTHLSKKVLREVHTKLNTGKKGG
jgi:3-methyladenine DNA glycosylase AlkD